MIEREDFKIKQRKIKEAYLETLLEYLVRNLVKFANSKICYENFFKIHKMLEPFKLEDFEYKSYLHTSIFEWSMIHPHMIDYNIEEETEENDETYFQVISDFEKIVPFSTILKTIKLIFKQVEKITAYYKPHEFKELHSSLKKLKKLDYCFISDQAIKEINNMISNYRKEEKPIEKKGHIKYISLNSLYKEFVINQIISHFETQYELSEAFDLIIKQNKKGFTPDKKYYSQKLFFTITDFGKLFGLRYYDEYEEVEFNIYDIMHIYEEGKRVDNYIVSDIDDLKIDDVLLRIMKCKECNKYIFDEKHRRRHAKNIFCGPQCKDLWHRKKRKQEGYYKKWYNKYYKRHSNTTN